MKQGIILKETSPARCGFRSIVFANNLYHLFEEDYLAGYWQIFKRTSKDGIILSPKSKSLFSKGEKGTFNEYGQADPTVIFDGQWKMWYDAFNADLIWENIGYATSEDGETWVNHGPVLSRGGKWDSVAVHHPVCIKHDKYYLYYSGSDGGSYPVRNIMLATSEDGINWTKIKDPVIPRGEGWEKEYVRPSCPIFIKGQWYMFYWGFSGHHHMGLALSDDLIHWKKQGQVLACAAEHEGITGSCPIRVGDKVRIYYASWDDWFIRMTEYE